MLHFLFGSVLFFIYTLCTAYLIRDFPHVLLRNKISSFQIFLLFSISSISGMSLSAGSSPLHSPKITPHTSPAPRRRSHTPNPANYMVPTTASDQAAHIIQKETVGGTTYFYTDNTPAPMAGMVRLHRGDAFDENKTQKDVTSENKRKKKKRF